jgi:hypothetical protein
MNSKIIFVLVAIVAWTQGASIEPVEAPKSIEDPNPRLCIWPQVGGTLWLWNSSNQRETFTSNNQCRDTPNALGVSYRSGQAAFLEDVCVVYANTGCVGDPEYTLTITGYFRMYTAWPIKSYKCSCRWQ